MYYIRYSHRTNTNSPTSSSISYPRYANSTSDSATDYHSVNKYNTSTQQFTINITRNMYYNNTYSLTNSNYVSTTKSTHEIQDSSYATKSCYSQSTWSKGGQSNNRSQTN